MNQAGPRATPGLDLGDGFDVEDDDLDNDEDEDDEGYGQENDEDGEEEDEDENGEEPETWQVIPLTSLRETA